MKILLIMIIALSSSLSFASCRTDVLVENFSFFQTALIKKIEVRTNNGGHQPGWWRKIFPTRKNRIPQNNLFLILSPSEAFNLEDIEFSMPFYFDRDFKFTFWDNSTHIITNQSVCSRRGSNSGVFLLRFHPTI